MINCCCGIFKIFFLGLIHNRLFFGIMHLQIYMSTICECSAYANCAYCIKSVGILNNFPSSVRILVFTPAPLNDIVNIISQTRSIISLFSIFHQYIPCNLWPNCVVSVVEFPIWNIMQKAHQFNNKHISRFFPANVPGHLPDPINMPPIMTRRFSF